MFSCLTSCCRFKNTSCMMHMGNMTKDFVPVGKEEQAEIKNEDNSEKVASLLGIGESTKIEDNLSSYTFGPFLQIASG